jgi:hypothetical protein
MPLCRYNWLWRGPHVNEDQHNNLASIKLEYLGDWLKNHAPPNPIVLITGWCDYYIGEEYRPIADSDQVIKWYAMNAIMDHPKLKPIPVGPCYYVRPIVDDFYNNLSRTKKTKLIHSRYSFNGPSRDECSKHTGLYNREYLPYDDYMQEMAESMFTISPNGGTGGSIDPSRTWEALLVKSIPINTRNPMVNMGLYEGLPVLFLNSWKEFGTLKLNEELYHRMMDRFDPNCFTYRRWIKEL